MTGRAKEVLQGCEVILGYRTYLRLLSEEFPGKEFRESGMKNELKRCQEAVREAFAGRKAALISSGDAGIYGMAGPVLEMVREMQAGDAGSEIYLEVVPGVTAAQASASLLGAPLMNDFAMISLSDLLTDWETIQKRLNAAADGDFVIVLINPKSKGRTQQIVEAQKILLGKRSGEVPVGIVRSALRGESGVVITDLNHMLDHEIDMLSTVIVGNSDTKQFGEVLVTSRGYKIRR
jgi:precorrin-3B C17-methyltransferase